MGIIRGSHTSPGIYTKITDKQKSMNIRNNRKQILEAKSQPGSGGGGGEKPFEGLKFVALADNSTIGLVQRSTNQTTLEYSTDGENWVDFATSVTLPLEHIGDEVHVRGKLTGDNTLDNYTQFTMSGKIAAIGNINYLWNYDNLSQNLYQYCGYNLFNDCTGLVDSGELTLGTSATTLANWCYFDMFGGCSGLTIAPKLPATTLASGCYYYMFQGCSSLTTAPELPATTLADYCYGDMFYNCTSLTTAPELPATTLAQYCYSNMFYGCTSLTTAPELSATTLATECYSCMFWGCTSLTTAPELPATTLAYGCYSDMFLGCTSLTTAPVLSATTLADFCYSGMFCNCTSLTTAPELSATTLASSCYEFMFRGCTSLNYIKCLAIDGMGLRCTFMWMEDVPTGQTAMDMGCTFIKNPNVSESTWGIDESGIPDGWDIEDTIIN